MNFVPIIPFAAKVVETIMDRLLLKEDKSKPSHPDKVTDNSEENAKLREELAKYRQQHAELLSRFDVLTGELKRKKIESFEELEKQDQQAKQALVQLAKKTEAAKLPGINVALFGLTSTGKSTMLNALLGENLAETGVGETTTKIKSYKGKTTNFLLWDVPGRNDEVSYLSMEYVSFFKGLTRRLILIQATVKENSSMMKLLDELGLRYDIVFNKFDKVDVEEHEIVKKQIQTEIKTLGLRGVDNVYFVSAKHPKMFDDWLQMVHRITG